MQLCSGIALGLLVVGTAVTAQTSLPIVDLGYERHQAINFNDSAQTYNFSNIRFAQPPLGDLRFRAPVPAWTGTNSSVVNNGSVGAICPQALPPWTLVTAAFESKYFVGQPFNETEYYEELAANGTLTKPVPVDPRTTEDCLVLDVVVPQHIFKRANSTGAPVLVWIYGGGFTEGEKTGFGEYNPYGLFERAQTVSGEKFIWVALNYRLGAFGWLAGPTLQSDGVANAALYDQRTALEWVQKYIPLFGGDPDRVTVMGESAGGGSIMHQITAFNGDEPTPFAQAIPQSPAWFPTPDTYSQEKTFNDFLKFANVSSISAARNLTTEQLQLANALQIANSLYGQFTYTPVVDGIFAPQLPGRALLSGANFDPNLKILVGHNGDEGLSFSQPNVTTEAAFENFIKVTFPAIQSSVFDTIVNELYPAVFDGSQGYADNFQRATLAISDSVFTCNTFYLDKGFQNKTYSYEFNVPPAIHGQDVTYSFAWNDSSQVAPNVAEALQEYIVSFVITGDPNRGKLLNGVPKLPVYGKNNTVEVLAANITNAKDYLAGPRCNFWQKALYA